MRENSLFYGDKLRLARLFKGYTQSELGESVYTSRQYIHQLENGSRIPTKEVWNALSESLNVKSSFFSLPLNNDIKSEHAHFRKRRTTQTNYINRTLSYGTLFESVVDELESHLNLPEINFPEIEIKSAKDIEVAAEQCRSYWGIDLNSPIRNLTRVLEYNGIIVTTFNSVTEKVDALSFSRNRPIIVLNTSNQSTCRIRFDLAHELGHIVMHEGIETGDVNTESQADRFAGAFLFPVKAFINEFRSCVINGTFRWKAIYDLKVRWGMSVRAIIYRAHQLKLIDARQYRRANVWLSKSGQAKKEKRDNEILLEAQELVPNAFATLSKELNIKTTDIANNLCITEELLEELTGVGSNDDSNPPNNVVDLAKFNRKQ